MRILYVAMKYDYGDAARGYSFEHHNFFGSLRGMGFELIYFDPIDMAKRRGREQTNKRLLEVVKAEQPEVLFCVLFTDELDPRVMRAISRDTDTATVNWFCDDHWRFDDFSCYWAPAFNYAVTTASSAVPKYEAMGYEGMIKSQWAVNHFEYRRLEVPIKYDVTFVGQPHGNRRALIDALQQLGIDVQVWGHGWESGRIGQSRMIEVFNESRVNLNLSNASAPPKASVETGWLYQLMARLPGGRYYRGVIRRLERLSRRIRSEDPMRTLETIDPGYVQQIKARNFEVPGCGGFMLSGDACDLAEYYELDREIVAFRSAVDLVERVRYYLDHEDERRAIADAGFERTMREHTYAHRFDHLFGAMNVESPPLEVLLAGGDGDVLEVD